MQCLAEVKKQGTLDADISLNRLLFKGSVLALCNKAKSRLGNGRFVRNICTKIHKLAQRNVKFARQT